MLKKILLLMIVPVLGFCHDHDPLIREDIHKIMQQIFSQHVNKKVISNEILTNSFKAYFEQFDPQGIYLLESDVAPFLTMSDAEIAPLISQYKNDDYSIYEKINGVIQTSIFRARKLREEITKTPKALYDQALNTPLTPINTQTPNYARTEPLLKAQIKNYLIEFLQVEIKRFGPKRVHGFESQALSLYEKQMRDYEDQYLFTELNGENVTPQEKENLLSLHILKSLTKSLDAHTAFMDKQEADDMRVRLEKGFEGIGIAFQESPQGILVASVIKDGPADIEGQIKAGDILTEIDGIKMSDISFEKAMKMVKGDKNEPIHLILERTGEKESKTLDVHLKRDTIVLNEDRVDVTSEKFGDGIIGRITLHSFYQNDKGVTSENDVRVAIDKLKEEGHLRGLILDLRDNSGGFLSQAVKVAGLFITNGVVVISKYSNGGEKIYRDVDNGIDYKGPLIVLTSRATASAAEIVAEALQDYGIALIVGDEQTYGKGTIQSQTITDNKGGSFFKVTVGKYYTVSGKTPQINGVKADVIVPGPYSHVHLGEEYLEHTLSSKDEIAPSFTDALEDIDPELRPWYLRYYIPTVQKKIIVWREEIPQLQKNSKQRITNNKNYQAFLNLIQHKGFESLKEELSEENDPKNFGANDLQLTEAYNVLKDMISLAPTVRLKEYIGVQTPVKTQRTK